MTNRIHVQHVLLSLQPGGLENGVVNVVNRLSASRFRSSICCLKHGGEFAARVSPGVEIYEMGWRGGNDPRLALRLASLFRRTRPDVVHTRNAESFYYGFLAARLAGVPCIVHSEHGRAFDDSAFRFRVQRWFSARTSAIFAVSHQLKGDLVAHVGIPEQRIQVLHNGVDLGRFVAGDGAAVRRQLGLAPDAMVIGSVGRLVPVKNYPLLIKAVAALRASGVVLLLVGEGPERARLEALAADLGISSQVRLLGHRDDVTSLLAAMDIFVLPSLNEGMSNTLLEAMATGLPCVVSNVGGNLELVDHDAEGYLFASGDEQALREHLARLCKDASLRKRLGDAGRARVEGEFSIEAMIERYENLYIATLSGSGRFG